MSALQYLNVMTKKIKQSDKKIVDTTTKEKKQFKHGNNIVMKVGTYKGYLGYVYEYFPSKVEIELEDQQYVDVSKYGDHPIGSTITTEFGDSTIIEKKKKVIMFNMIEKLPETEKEIELKNNEESLLTYAQSTIKQSFKKFHLNFNEDDVMPIIQYKKDGNLRIGIYTKSNDKYDYVCPIRFPQTPIPNTESIDILEKEKTQLISKLSEKIIKEGSLDCGQDIQKIKKKNILSPVNYIVIKGEYKGLYSDNGYEIIPSKYLISYKKSIEIIKSQLKRKTSKLFEITSGSYKGKTAEIIRTFPSHLSIYINAIGKKITTHMVKENDKYVERKIYPSDVFYMDLLLNNNNSFEVKQITEDNTIIGLEDTQMGLIPRQIKQNEIASLHPGFAFTESTKENIKLEESVYSYGDQTLEETDFQENEDGEEEQFEELEPEEEQEEQEQNVESEFIEEETYKSSYKDIERITFQGELLTKDQQKIKTRIEKITNLFSINVIDEYKLIDIITQSIKDVKRKLKNANLDFWNVSDEKYIIATLVLFDIIKSGFGHMISNIGDDMLSSYIRTLLSETRPFFNKKDYSNSIFTKSEWSDSFTVDDKIFKALVNSRDDVEIHKYIMMKCISFMESIYGKINLDIKMKKQDDLISLGKRKYEDEPRTRITVKDIFTENVTSDANTILWGIAYQPLLEKYKTKLIEKINDEKSNKTTKLIYDYVLQNLEKGMFVIPEIKQLSETTKSELDKLRYEKLNTIWSNLLNNAKEIYTKLEKEKQQKRKERESQRKELLSKRETISTMKKLKTFGLEDTDEDLELIQERKYPEQLEKMVKKYKL